MKKTMVVDAKFNRKDDKYTVKVTALHNGAHVIDKAQASSINLVTVFDFVNAFIEKHDATNISLKRGYIEDSFAKYLTDIQAGAPTKEKEEIEGILVSSISEENRALLNDLATYKLCVEDAVRHEDYEGMLLQGILYNSAREELMGSEGQLANPFEIKVEVPLSEKEKVVQAIVNIAEAEVEIGIEPIAFKANKRIVEVYKTDYKLTVNFS